MEDSLEFQRALLRVLDFVGDRKTYLTQKEGVQVAGNWWHYVIPELYRMECGAPQYPEGFYVIYPEKLKALRDKTLDRVGRLEKQEADRELANKEKLENMKYGKRGFWISIVALILSATAILINWLK